MINQIGSPTLFFTLSAADTKWPDLQRLLSNGVAIEMQTNKQRLENVINNPHTTSLYLHQRFTVFREEVIEKLLGAQDYWYKYEWQHRGTAHVHGFLWLQNAPNMDKLDWDNSAEIE